MQATLTYNPRDVLEVRAAILHLEAVHTALLDGAKPDGAKPDGAGLTIVNRIGEAPEITRHEPAEKPEAPKATRTRKVKDEPKAEEPPAEAPPAEEPAAEQPAAQEPDLDNFGDDAPAPAKEYTHDDLRDAVKKVMSKDASKRPSIGNVLGKYTTDRQIPSVPAAKLAAVIAEVEALA